MTNVRHIFVDTNVLTRATMNAAPLHHEARALLDKLWDESTELYISHQVIREYVANATRPQTYSPALPVDAVLEQVEDFRKSFHILPGSPAVLSKLQGKRMKIFSRFNKGHGVSQGRSALRLDRKKICTEPL